MAVNRNDTGSTNVSKSQFIQRPTDDNGNTLQPNSDITQKPINLYYTDIDIENPAELFMTEAEAADKASCMSRKFPNYIVEFYMYYYENYPPSAFNGWTESQKTKFKTDYNISNDIDLGTYSKDIVITRICKCVPGTASTLDNYREVKRRNLKKLYDKVDFIRVYRPKNTIKWYTVSNEKLKEELAVIKEFYGLTNFPDKVGEYYYSKKIGKWLATEELGTLLKLYKDDIPVIYVDEIGEGQASSAEHKTLAQIILEGIAEMFKNFGTFLKGILGKIFDKEAWDNLWDAIMTDENHNYIPDNIENFWSNLNIQGIKLFDFSWLDKQNANDFTTALKNFREQIANALKIGSGRNDNTNLSTIIENKVREIQNNYNDHSGWGWLSNLQGFKDWFSGLFGITFNDNNS